MSRETDAE